MPSIIIGETTPLSAAIAAAKKIWPNARRWRVDYNPRRIAPIGLVVS